MSVKIMIDSASDITKEEAEELGFLFMPIQVRLGEEEYFDGVDLLPSEFYEKLVTSKDRPQTSLINSYRWNEAFEDATKNGDEVVAITLSSKISGSPVRRTPFPSRQAHRSASQCTACRNAAASC